MDRLGRDCPDNLLIIVESSKNPHKEIIQSTIAERAYQIFEKRGCKHGFDLEDWKSAEKELLREMVRRNFTFLLSAARSVDGLLHVDVPKKNHHKVRVRRSSTTSFRAEDYQL